MSVELNHDFMTQWPTRFDNWRPLPETVVATRTPEWFVEEAAWARIAGLRRTVWTARQLKLPSGRIPDIVAGLRYDAGRDYLLVVECKATAARYAAVAQLAGYLMEIVSLAPGQIVVGALAAPSFHPEVERWARRQFPQFTLWQVVA